MPLSDRLRARRHAQFVGREAELSLVRSLLLPEAPPAVVWIHGPGGVGKTSLLREIGHACAEAGVPAGAVDLQTVEPTPDALATALGVALDAASFDATPYSGDGDGGREAGGVRGVLLVDTAEVTAPLDDWLREVWLPAAPDRLLVVLAGRHAPGRAWTADPGWASLLHVLALGPLSDADGRVLLAARGVDPDRHADLLAFARGHPMALALAAEAIERDPEVVFGPLDTPDVVGPLVQRFLARSASADLREAIEACAVVRRATEPLLETLLERPVPSALFDDLSGLPIVEAQGGGLVLHSLVRDVVLADLRWRAPERDARLHARARHAYTARLHAATTPEAQRDVLADYAFLYRDAPIAGPLLAQLQHVLQGGLRLDAATPVDHAAIVAAVTRHEGAEAAEIAAHWLDLQPAGASVVRGADGEVAGLLVRVRLDQTTASERAADPLAIAAYGALRRVAPRDGEAVLLFRFWMDRDAHQGVSAVQALLFAQTVWDYLATPRLAVSLLACAEPNAWAPVLTFAGLHPWPDARARTGEVTYTVFGHDWRAEPPDVWLDGLAGRLPGAAAASPPPPTLVVLSRAAFDDAVRDALRVVARPGQLLGNPLLESRLVRDRLALDGGDPDDDRARTETLARLIAEAVADLATGRRGEAHAAAVRAAYLRPAPSQEVAAERLGVPYSTFRRHLARGIEGVTDALWARDEGRVPPAAVVDGGRFPDE